MNKIRILIADDHKLVREIWTQILDSDPRFNVIASCGDSEDAVGLAKKYHPDIVLMDISMAPYSGIEATQKIRRVSPSSRTIGVSMYSKPDYAKRIFYSGARGYVTKNSSREEMIEAILEVNSGNKYICKEIKDIISVDHMEGKGYSPDVSKLSEREMQIMNLVRLGSSSREIAQTLLISKRTVEVHRNHILRKLKLKNTASLVNFVNSSANFF